MSTATGTPVFVTVGGDASAATVSTDGGKTSQTLSELATGIATQATAIAQAQSDASSAKTAAQTNTEGLSTVNTTIENLGETYINKDLIGIASGVVGTDSGNGVSVPLSASTQGYVTYPSTATDTYLWMSATQYTQHGASSPNMVQGINAGLHMGGSSRTINSVNTPTMYLEVIADVFQPMHITCDLGQSDAAWANIYSATAVQVTSDESQKTVSGSLGDSTYTVGQKLADALFSVDACLYQLNTAITDKGATNARLHAGFIAQQIQSAITSAGLDPSQFALWTNSPLSESIKTDTGKKDANGNEIYSYTQKPKLDSDGKQVYGQMLRYEELLCVLFEAAKTKINSQEKDITSLSARVTALEAKTTATTSAS